jgi:hypothetical protein
MILELSQLRPERKAGTLDIKVTVGISELET